MKSCDMAGMLATVVLAVLVAVGHVRAHSPGEDMAEAAKAFLAALTPDQRAQTVFKMREAERANWHFVPRPRQGLPWKTMTPEQQQLAHALLSTGLSQRGFVKAATIMSLEQVLHELEGANRQFPRDPLLYYVSIFGKPGPKATWGWRVEGHHLSLNFTLINGAVVSVTPSFFGANPAEVKAGPRRGLRALREEEDLARQLVTSLNDTQRQTAIIAGTAYRDILTGAARKVTPLSPTGLPARQMTDEQRALLHRLIREYVERYRPECARQDLEKIDRAGGDQIGFAWAGGLERGQGHYYRVQGPTFLLEYDNTQNDANHIHSVWRDFENDFGEDLLRRHYEQVPHER